MNFDVVGSRSKARPSRSDDRAVRGVGRRSGRASTTPTAQSCRSSPDRAPPRSRRTCSSTRVIGRFEGYFPGYSSMLRQEPELPHLGRAQGAHQQHRRRGDAALGRPARAAGHQLPLLRRRQRQPRRGPASAVAAGVALARRLAAGLKARGSIAEEEMPGDERWRCGAARLRPAARVGSPRVVHLPHRPPRGRRRRVERLQGARRRGASRRRRVGLPAHSGLLHRQRGLHDRREGGGRDCRRGGKDSRPRTCSAIRPRRLRGRMRVGGVQETITVIGRDAGGGRADQHAQADGARRRGDLGAAGLARLRQPAHRRPGRPEQQPRQRRQPDDGVLHRARRPRQRRHGADRRHERRLGVQRRRRGRASATTR